MDIRTKWLPAHSVEALQRISSQGALPLNALCVDDLMSLGGHGLIKVHQNGSVLATKQGTRFLSNANARLAAAS